MKLELCEKAEALDKESDLKSAIIQLNEFHDEYKHLGPVPKEEQEPSMEKIQSSFRCGLCESARSISKISKFQFDEKPGEEGRTDQGSQLIHSVQF